MELCEVMLNCSNINWVIPTMTTHSSELPVTCCLCFSVRQMPCSKMESYVVMWRPVTAIMESVIHSVTSVQNCGDLVSSHFFLFQFVPIKCLFACLKISLSFPKYLILRGNQVSRSSHTYPDKPWRNIKVSTCNRQTDRPLYVWSDLVICKFGKVWSYMTPNVLTETGCL